MSDETAALRAEIRDAFAARAHPGDERIARVRSECEAYEGNAMAAFLRGKDWRELTPDFLATGTELGLGDLMAFLTFEGFVYYLPAFLQVALDLDGPLALDEPLVFKLWSFPEEVASRLEPAEKRAVVRTLEHLAADYERRGYQPNHARRALDDYWAYFTDRELMSRRSEEETSHALSD